MKNTYGAELPFPQLRYCTRCCMPETREGIEFDELGICNACKAAEEKMHIDWVARERQFREVLESAKAKTPDTYNCVVPISGGKDSTFQLHVLVNVYKLKVLAVTCSHNWFTETGKRNLRNALEVFNVDHIMFTPNRALVNKLARKSLFKIGDPCWHCHSGVIAFPLIMAVKLKIPLLVYGESASEHGRSSYINPHVKFDRDYGIKVSAKVKPDEMVDDEIEKRDLVLFKAPSVEEIEATGVEMLHLGDFMFWDDERQTEFVKATYGWQEDEVEGTYKKYKSVECLMPGVHDYAKFVKRGFGRATDHACQDVRAGLLTREEGFELAKKIDSERPKSLDFFLKITGLSEKEFYDACKSLRKGPATKLPLDE